LRTKAARKILQPFVFDFKTAFRHLIVKSRKRQTAFQFGMGVSDYAIAKRQTINAGNGWIRGVTKNIDQISICKSSDIFYV
jgi:hypothetical protein